LHPESQYGSTERADAPRLDFLINERLFIPANLAYSYVCS